VRANASGSGSAKGSASASRQRFEHNAIMIVAFEFL
jgi:hypothetical protein